MLLAGCLGPEKVRQSVSFDPQEVESLLRSGSNTVKGSALINQVGGGSVTCAGRTVNLIPRSRYADERMEIIYGNLLAGVGMRRIPESDPASELAYMKTAKETVCNAQGFFIFEGLADGEYYITTQITWGQYNEQGGNLMRSVTIAGGQTIEVVLSP